VFAAQSCLLARGRRGEGNQADLQPAGPRQPEGRQRTRQEGDPVICLLYLLDDGNSFIASENMLPAVLGIRDILLRIRTSD
jgi:hypothetical protein